MISKMEITGKIKEILELKEFDSGFRKREFVVTTQEQYPQDILLEFTKDKCDLLDNLNQDDEVNVCFNLRGNEYNGKYFVNLQAWRIEKKSTSQIPTTGFTEEEQDDDLSF
ncbi:MAG: DUF3127 domain-containing protein [Candidatus Kariarchaeaceae archaeon]